MPENQKEKKNIILLVEDDKFLINALGDKLRQENYNVVKATNGLEALNKLREVQPDLILLDLIMPGKNGFETLEEIKKDPKLKNIPVIVLTNLGQQTDIKLCKELGAVDYLVKSDTSLKEVIEKIKPYL